MDKQISPEEASRVIKEMAAEQQVRLELTREQFEALSQYWTQIDPHKPAQLTFFVEERPMAELQMAAYSYRGDTCCA